MVNLFQLLKYFSFQPFSHDDIPNPWKNGQTALIPLYAHIFLEYFLKQKDSLNDLTNTYIFL